MTRTTNSAGGADEAPIDFARLFGDAEQLELHQLRLLEWMATTGRKRFVADSPEDAERPRGAVPDMWRLTAGIQRYPWQDEAARKWLDNGGRGTVKVVTGGGKTLLALSVAE